MDWSAQMGWDKNHSVAYLDLLYFAQRNETGHLRVRYSKMWKFIFSQWNALLGSSCRSGECVGELLLSSAIIIILVGIRRILSFSSHSVTKKVLKNGLTELPFGGYFYLISSTSMQKENQVTISVRQIKIRCAKYKCAERSHNFLMQLLMQLICGDF